MEALYKLVKSAISELNLDLKEIVGKTFDGGAKLNINSLDAKGNLIKNGRVLPTLCPVLWACAQVPRPSGYYNTE